MNGSDELEHLWGRLLPDLARLVDQLDLVGRLDRPLFEQPVVERLEPSLGDLFVLVQREVRTLHRDVLQVYPVRQLVQFLGQTLLPHHRFNVRRFALDLFCKSVVAEDAGLAPLGRDEVSRVADEAREVAGVDRIGYQQRILARGKQAFS